MQDKRVQRLAFYGIGLIIWSFVIIGDNLLNKIKTWEIVMACSSFCFGIFFLIMHIKLKKLLNNGKKKK